MEIGSSGYFIVCKNCGTTLGGLFEIPKQRICTVCNHTLETLERNMDFDSFLLRKTHYEITTKVPLCVDGCYLK